MVSRQRKTTGVVVADDDGLFGDSSKEGELRCSWIRLWTDGGDFGDDGVEEAYGNQSKLNCSGFGWF